MFYPVPRRAGLHWWRESPRVFIDERGRQAGSPAGGEVWPRPTDGNSNQTGETAFRIRIPGRASGQPCAYLGTEHESVASARLNELSEAEHYTSHVPKIKERTLTPVSVFC